MKISRDGFALAALLIGTLSPLAAQEPVQAPDTAAQGYAPTAPAPAAAPAAVPYTPPSAPPAAPAPAAAARAAPVAGPTVAQALGFIDVLPARSVDRIRSDLESAKAAEREADARISDASAQRAETKARIEVKK